MRNDISHRLPLDEMPTSESGTMRRGMRVVRNADMDPYMDLVHQEVARMMRRLPANVQKGDLISAGARGLMDALSKTAGEDRGPQFEWYARIRIRGAVMDELRNEDWLSRSARAAVRNSSQDVSNAQGIVIGFDDMPEHKRLVPVSQDESPLDIAERHSQRLALGRAVDDLPEREAQIIEMHYFQGIQFKDIASVMNVSEPRISQLHARAVGILRESLRDEWV